MMMYSDEEWELIQQADLAMPISEVLAECGIGIPSEIVGSWKHRCPWAWEHPDGGLERNCRSYPSNTMHCFAIHGTMRPTQILARWRNGRRLQIAEDILKERGLLKPKTAKEMWAAADERTKETPKTTGRSSDAVTALQQSLAGEEIDDLSLPVQEAWQAVLEDLDTVMAGGTVGLPELKAWLARSRDHIMAAAALER